MIRARARPSVGAPARSNWRPRPARKTRWINADNVPFDGVFAFLLISAALFVGQFGALAGAAMAGLPLIFMLLRRRRLAGLLTGRLALMLIPAFALLSAVWSEAPSVSARYAVEMVLTVAGAIALSASDRPAATLKGVCAAFLIYIAVALALGRSVAASIPGGAAFAGVSDSKNVLADIASFGALVSLAVLTVSLRQRRPTWLVVSLLALGLEIYVVFIARSAGAMLGMAAAILALAALIGLSRASKAIRIGSISLLATAVAVAAIASHGLADGLVGMGLRLFDKDPTLTGRTYLWYRAQDLVAEKPWLGRGFYAFWRKGNTDAEGLWRYAGVTDQGGFNFHNSLVEITVQLGWIGASLFCLLALAGAVGLARRYVVRPSLPLCFWIAIFVYALVRAPIEAVGYAPFYFSTILLFAAAAVGLAPLEPGRRRETTRRTSRAAAPAWAT
jgi:exopolysaccharide production protein ExoQ